MTSTSTTLTREALLAKVGKPRYEEVEIEGLGTVGIRSRTRLQATSRMFACMSENGKVDPRKQALQPIYRLIDQVMVDEKTPMFTDADVDLLAGMPDGELDELFAALQQFNETVEPAKKKDESTDTNAS